MLRTSFLLTVASITAIGALPLGAFAQSGPDVIVGELPDVAFYTSSGAVSGMHAYAVGTLSCNIGTQPLEWIASTNRHPVISQNMYRLQNGRFEHIGQAHLKHGFTALQGNVCSTCTPHPNGTYLGVGCSDPYSASLNGGQSGLGPKYEVNPSTGFFPYPFTNIPGSGTLNRRLQVRQTDLALPGALYFVASMYIAPDDIAAGNGNNNSSYRRVTINANYSLSLQDTTQRTKPAIQAWKDHGLGANVSDPNVTITNADVPGDGRFILGCKVSNNGNGTYHYEYAIQNLRSDRAGQAFTIPIPAGVNITNVGFHDVDYHSGEPYALTDWTPTVTSTSVSWACQTQAQNPNANALRWDTVYNFRFDADSAPGSGAVSLTLFKPGTPTSINIAAQIPGGGPPPDPVPPANDACTNAIVVGAGATSFTSNLATTDGPAESLCLGSTGQVDGDVWFRYTAPCDGTVTVATCGSSFDSRIAIYNAACPTASDTAIACSDDSAACGASSTQSSVSFSAFGSAQYLVRVGGTGGATGAGTLTITPPTCTPTGPANDACANAITLIDGSSVVGTTALATNDASATCGSSASSPDVWYAYTPSTSGSVSVSTCNSASFDTVLAVYSACGGSQLACLDDTTSCSGYTTTLVTSMTAGTRYLIRVSGYNGASGAFTVSLTGGGGGATPPATNDCANRAGVGLGATPFSTVNATTDGIAHASCLSSGQTQITNDIWFNYPATQTGNLVVSTCGSGFDTFIAVYNGYGCADFETRLMGCNDDFACGTGTGQSQMVVPVVSGTSYTIRIGGYNNATGSGSLTLSMQAPPPVGDTYAITFRGATAVPGLGTVQDEDIVTYNTGTGQWSLLFDGSDVGLAALAIDGLAFTSSGDLLLSFIDAGSITGMTGGPSGATIDDSDIVRFIPTSTGANTAGSFVFYFDASDVGLTTDNEDVDAIGLLADGRLVLSTLGNASAGASADDEDLLVFTSTSLGSVTAGSLSLYFDGSDVGLSTNDEDIDAVALNPDSSILLSTIGNFAVTGVSGGDEDVFRFAPTSVGSNTAGTFSMLLDLSSLGFAAAADIGDIERYPTGPRYTDPVSKPDDSIQCLADFNADAVVDSRDLFAFLTEFLNATKVADFNSSGTTDTRDYFDYLSAFLAGCP